MRHLLDLLKGPCSTLGILKVEGLVALAVVAAAFAVGEDGDEDKVEALELKGSEPVPKDDSSDEVGEAQESQKLAEISQSAAEKAALQVVLEIARSAKLDNENGFVLYEVEVAGDDGQTHHVEVDAGNGKVLQ